MTQTLDFRLAQGDDRVLKVPTAGGASALQNRASTGAPPAVHTPLAATITPFIGIKLTAVSSGLFMTSLMAMLAAVAADVVTTTITVYTDAVPGVPLTLPANAALVAGSGGVYVDNSGAGIAPSAGATAGSVITAPAQTIGTAAADEQMQFVGLLSNGGTPIPIGSTFYVTMSVTDSAAARAITQAFASSFELP